MNLTDYINQVTGCEDEWRDLEPAFTLTLWAGGEDHD